MRTLLLPLDRITDAHAAAWRTLAAQAAEPNAFLDPRFLRPARALAAQSADLRMLVVEDRGEWIAALAVTTHRLHPRLPLRATTTGGPLMTPYADRHHPLLHAGRPAEALEALLHGCARARLPRLLQLHHFPTDGPLATALAQVAPGHRRGHRLREAQSAYAWRTAPPPDPAAPQRAEIVDPPLATAHLTTKDRQNLRRRARGLAEAAAGPLVLHDLGTDPSVDEQFLDLQAAGWKGEADHGGAALRLDPEHERWFRGVTAAFRRDGDLVATRLSAGGRTLWIGYALRSGGVPFGYLDAFAEEHARFSPGSLGRVAMMTHVLTATPAPAFDPAFDPRYGAVTRLFPDRRTYADLLVPTGGPVARAVVEAVRRRAPRA